MKAYMIVLEVDKTPALRNLYRTHSAAKKVANKINSDSCEFGRGRVVVVCADNWHEEVTPE